MSHLFLWTGREPQRYLSLALAFFGRSSRPEAQADASSDWYSMVAVGSERWDARVASQPGPSGTTRLLASCGHAWPRMGPPLRNTAPIADVDPCDEVRLLRERFDGVFGLSSADTIRGRLAVACDLLGSFHLYWRELEDGIAVSSSSRLLACLAPSRLDPIGVQEFVGSATANEDRSVWQGIRKLRGSQILVLDRDGSKTIESHRPLLALLRGPARDLDASISAMHRSIGSVLARVTTSGKPIVDVTGGNDSRALAAAMVSHGHPFTSTVTGPDESDDVRISAALARIGGWPHAPRPPFPPPDFESLRASLALTDGEYDIFEFSGIAGVHRTHMSEGFDLSLNGSYGETGRGYPWRLGPKALLLGGMLAARLATREPIDVRAQAARRFRSNTGPLFVAPLRLDWPSHGAEMIQRLVDACPGLPQCAHLDLIHIDLRMERWQGRIASSTNHLWPAVSPWGFQDCLSVLLTAHPRARRNSLLTRAYTQFAAPRIAEIPLFTGNPAMPFTWRNARKFLPAITYYLGRARAKSGIDRAAPSARPPSMQEKFAPAFRDSPLYDYLREPMLAQTGLFQSDALMGALDVRKPRSESEATTWCRLTTLETLLRDVSVAGAGLRRMEP